MSEQNEFFRHFFNYADDMMCVAGLDGYFKILNPAWNRTLGWSTEVLLEQPWEFFVYPEDLESTRAVGGDIINGKLVFTFENCYRCKDGSYR
jgi:PAS domain S-box-containing protein